MDMVTANTPHIEIEETDTALMVRLNRPEKRNALNLEVTRSLKYLFEQLHDNPEKGVLLTGNGSVTTAGADVAVIGGDDDTKKNDLIATINDIYKLIEGYPRPTVMAAKGAAVGAGFHLAITADFAVLGEETTFLKPEIEYGVFSEYSTRMLKHYFGAQIAKEIALAGNEILPEQALEWGMVTDIVPDSEVEDYAWSLLERLVDYDSNAYRMTKEALSFGAEPTDFDSYP
jgi:enoyl-CoA hydratase/carnithine racemase